MANKILGAKGLLGNTGLSLNSIPSNILRSDDMAVVSEVDSTNRVYFYTFTESTNKTENSPHVIIPYDSIGNDVYGTWEILNLYINEEGFTDIYNNIQGNMGSKEYEILLEDWNTNNLNEGIHYYNITHNLNELHPIISAWNMFTNRLMFVNILSIDENNVRIETTEKIHLKIKILK